MPICEICGRSVNRRNRLEDNRLVCWECKDILEACTGKVDPELICKRLKDTWDWGKRGWDTASQLREARNISFEKSEYKYNNPISAVPPIDILEKSLLAVDMMSFFSNFSEVLGDYYGFKAPPYYINDEKVKDANAIYCWDENTVYTPKKGVLKHRTAFHEIWHALERHGVVPHTKDSEKNAELYARACLRRLGHDENS